MSTWDPASPRRPQSLLSAFLQLGRAGPEETILHVQGVLYISYIVIYKNPLFKKSVLSHALTHSKLAIFTALTWGMKSGKTRGVGAVGAQHYF